MSLSSKDSTLNVTTSVTDLKPQIYAWNKFYKRQIHEDVCDLLVSVCFLQLHYPAYCQISPLINTILCLKYLDIEWKKVKQVTQ